MEFNKAKVLVETDVLVIGTGGAGLTAALAAHHAGAQVTLLEKSDKVGGTTAVSGGVVWVPNNHHMPAVGIPDSRAEALAYVQRLADGRSDDALIETLLVEGPAMVRFVEGCTPVKFQALQKYPDYHPEFEGAKPGGRALDPGLFDTNQLGPWQEKLRRSPLFGMTPMSVTEATEWSVLSKPQQVPYTLLGQRFAAGLVGYGGALVGGLLKALIERGIEPILGLAARAAVVEDGRVVGITTDQGLLLARRGVILASGGFEWSTRLTAQFLGGPLTHPNSPPTNEGDGLRIAMAVGADLGNMSEAWWCPSLHIPGEEYDGHPLNRAEFAIRSLPHSIMVNKHGQRFANEAQNYNDLMKTFFTFDPARYERLHLPAWLVLDQRFIERYPLLTTIPGMPVPEWLPHAPTLRELAVQMGIDPPGLEATVARFNGFARHGVDADFHRGESLYDRFFGDPDHQPNPNLGTIEKPPFYALAVHVGALGTKGGARTDGRARVLHVHGQPIPGLYAAGNVMAGVTGPGYPGAGSTIGAAMTFGFIAGRDAART